MERPTPTRTPRSQDVAKWIARRKSFYLKVRGGSVYFVDRGGWCHGGGKVIHVKKLLETLR